MPFKRLDHQHDGVLASSIKLSAQAQVSPRLNCPCLESPREVRKGRVGYDLPDELLSQIIKSCLQLDGPSDSLQVLLKARPVSTSYRHAVDKRVLQIINVETGTLERLFDSLKHEKDEQHLRSTAASWIVLAAVSIGRCVPVEDLFCLKVGCNRGPLPSLQVLTLFTSLTISVFGRSRVGGLLPFGWQRSDRLAWCENVVKRINRAFDCNLSLPLGASAEEQPVRWRIMKKVRVGSV